MEKEKLFEACLEEYIERKIVEGQKKFVILPMGDFGKRGKLILNKKGIDPILCLDNFNFDSKEVYPVDYIEEKKEEIKDAEILLLTDYKECENVLVEQIKDYVSKSTLFLTSQEIDFYTLRELKKGKTLELDFLCVGFAKCGTSSLYHFLNQNPYINLSTEKESTFLYNISVKAHESMLNSYEIGKETAIIKGGIEPTYTRCSKYTVEYFGEDIKIIFCLRNPVKGLFSFFKMVMRNCSSNYVVELYKKYKVPCAEMFKEYIEIKKDYFCYVDCIEEWLKFYPKEQMIFLISEEMFSHSEKVMEDLQKKLGLREEEILYCDSFPHSNEGTMVAKDYFCAKINNAVAETKNYFMGHDLADRHKILSLQSEIQNYTLMEFEWNLAKDLYDELLAYYMPSIKKLEIVIGKSLKDIWY